MIRRSKVIQTVLLVGAVAVMPLGAITLAPLPAGALTFTPFTCSVGGIIVFGSGDQGHLEGWDGDGKGWETRDFLLHSGSWGLQRAHVQQGRIPASPLRSQDTWFAGLESSL